MLKGSNKMIDRIYCAFLVKYFWPLFRNGTRNRRITTLDYFLDTGNSVEKYMEKLLSIYVHRSFKL